jgi:hypothetical protein
MRITAAQQASLSFGTGSSSGTFPSLPTLYQTAANSPCSWIAASVVDQQYRCATCATVLLRFDPESGVKIVKFRV